MGAIDNENKQLSGADFVARGWPVGNQIGIGSVLPATGTTKVTILTGAPGYFLTNIGIQVDPTTTIGVAGMVQLIFSDTSFGNVAVARFYIPASFTPPSVNNQIIQNGPGFAWNNQVANSSLQVSVDTTLTAGQVRFFARYANVSFLG